MGYSSGNLGCLFVVLETAIKANTLNCRYNKANEKNERIVAYDLRHHYAIANINSWPDDAFEFNDKLHYLSRSMGHRFTVSTLYYYSIVPRLADKKKKKTETGFNSIIPIPEETDEE